MNEFFSEEQAFDLGFQIEEAEKLKVVLSQEPQKQKEALQEVQKRLAYLEQHKTRIRDQLVEKAIQKGKDREIAEKESAKTMAAIFSTLEYAADKLGKSIEKALKSPSKSIPQKATITPQKNLLEH